MKKYFIAALTAAFAVLCAHAGRYDPSLPDERRQALKSFISGAQEQRELLSYYFKVHNVQDEGYDMVAEYATRLERRCQTAAHERAMLDSLILAPWLYDDTLFPDTGYSGQHDIAGQPAGYGVSIDSLAYYEGSWAGGKRSGFGFSIRHDGSRLQIGEWEADRYRGERLVYNSQRIYGIDISRYQHEIKVKGRRRRKVFAIDWSRLRIRRLGRLNRREVNMAVDYPVSFIFIKATEGASVVNKYFKADYTAARRHGYHAGAYHFFGMRTSGEAQAAWFLRYARFTKGDLPPVLDLEPSAAEIRRVGGARVMFARVRAWLKRVERATGQRPMLYVSQGFVNRYLSEAPDLKRDYDVWIAHYGEYKPDIRLRIWQMSPNGRVIGIRGDVDINVFNGYAGEWDDYFKSLR